VETAVRLKEYLSRISGLDIYSLLYEISRTPDIIPVSFKGRKSKEPVREKLNSKGVFVVNVGNSEATTAALMEWIEERTEYQIENAFHVYAAGTGAQPTRHP